MYWYERNSIDRSASWAFAARFFKRYITYYEGGWVGGPFPGGACAIMHACLLSVSEQQTRIHGGLRCAAASLGCLLAPVRYATRSPSSFIRGWYVRRVWVELAASCSEVSPDPHIIQFRFLVLLAPVSYATHRLYLFSRWLHLKIDVGCPAPTSSFFWFGCACQAGNPLTWPSSFIRG